MPPLQGFDKRGLWAFLDVGRLGLAMPLAAQDGLSREALPVKENAIEFSLPSQGWKIIRVRARSGG